MQIANLCRGVIDRYVGIFFFSVHSLVPGRAVLRSDAGALISPAADCGDPGFDYHSAWSVLLFQKKEIDIFKARWNHENRRVENARVFKRVIQAYA